MAGLERCVYQSFDPYTAEKTLHLLTKRWRPDFYPEGFIIYLRLAVLDVTTGKNGLTGERFPASAIYVSNQSIRHLAGCTRGKSFADQVGVLLDKT